MRVSVIGAGASGLVAAKKLLDQGATPVVSKKTFLHRARKLLKLTGGREEAA